MTTAITVNGGHFIKSAALVIILTLNGSSGIDLLDAIIMYAAKLTGA
mgnify:CR=1 FL=1|jgi:hypothetical protein